MNSRVLGALAIVVVVLAAALWWHEKKPDAAPESPVTVQAPPEPAVEAPAAPAPVADAAIKHPIDTPAAPIEAPNIEAAVTDLVGRKGASQFLLLDDLAHRIVATVDNLGRQHAASRLWPVVPTTGRFSVDQRDGASVIAAGNFARYTAFVNFIEAVDTARAVELYRRFYPALQAAYRELGYPKAYFNDRLVEVIDLLLETPEPEQSPAVALTDVKGPVAAQRPWVHYDFVDPDLQSLAAGQKVLLRMGVASERRTKAKLRDLRAELVKQPTGR